MAKHDPMPERIPAFDRTRGGGVAVERASKGYSLFSTATGAPIARLRPTGTGSALLSTASLQNRPSGSTRADITPHKWPKSS